MCRLLLQFARLAYQCQDVGQVTAVRYQHEIDLLTKTRRESAIGHDTVERFRLVDSSVAVDDEPSRRITKEKPNERD